jgi:hypothetical protein
MFAFCEHRDTRSTGDWTTAMRSRPPYCPPKSSLKLAATGHCIRESLKDTNAPAATAICGRNMCMRSAAHTTKRTARMTQKTNLLRAKLE